MVGDEAVTLDRDAVAFSLLAKDVPIGAAVAGNEKNVLTIVAAVGEMVRQAGQHDARNTQHGERLSQRHGGQENR